MAVTLDALLGTGNATGSATVSLVTANTVAANGRLVLLVGSFFTSQGTYSVTTAAGLTWTQDHTVVSGQIRVSIFSAPAPSGLAASSTITITDSGGSATGDLIIGGVSYLGIDTVGTVVSFNGAAAATAAWASGSISSNSGDAIVGGAWVDAGAVNSSTPTGPAVERVDVNIAGQSETITIVDKLTVAGADSVAGAWNTTGSHIAIGVGYKAAASGAAVVMTPTFSAIPFMK